MAVVEIDEGDSPLILGFPHTGTEVPADIAARLNDVGQQLADTDWHIHELYNGLVPGVTRVRATFHRYVIDANRDPSGTSLYPGQNTTGLIPETDFDNQPLWRDGQGPTAVDIADRLARFHAPYHAALAAQIARVKARHGVAILYDCHSIRSRIPFLFDGKLPDFNIGTDSGRTCDARLEAAAVAVTSQAPGYSTVLNGRFKGGWTTRHYGTPDRQVHAIQMELTQSSYLATETAPFAYDSTKAAKLRPILADLLQRLVHLAPRLPR
ncbi:N-formylglutamate amidohydrolase [Elstera litoralis]|uniref:N-formylglutamate amidohydrolase n=1 Tax=Elstera litoralis TaxID=552518 RepID=A0A0F3ISN3_9PROT|nr:N-formylglutamate deformylase [Elstera litoralis]KJV09632.1 N-formylglutamate amidohydrolase [Elstera litoralis]